MRVRELLGAALRGRGVLALTGNRTLWLEDFELPDELWAQFRIPIGLAFFMHSSVTSCIVAMYPSPAGATESELHFETWNRLVEMNPVLGDLEPDAEALLVNRMSEEPAYAIAPIDRCYMLVGLSRRRGRASPAAPASRTPSNAYFDELRERGGEQTRSPGAGRAGAGVRGPERGGRRHAACRRSTSTCM